MNTLTLDQAREMIARQQTEILRLQEVIAVMRDGQMCPHCNRREAHCTCYAPVKDGER